MLRSGAADAGLKVPPRHYNAAVMIGRALVLAALFAATTFAHGQCAPANSESTRLLDEVHRAALLDPREAESVVDRLTPQVVENILAGTPDRDWYRAAMYIAGELQRFDRQYDAQRMLELVAGSNPEIAGRWQRVARRAVEKAAAGETGSRERRP